MSNQSVFLLLWANRAVNRRTIIDVVYLDFSRISDHLYTYTYIPHFYKQSRKTWYEHHDGKISAELFGKHTQTIVSNSTSSKIAKVISTVELEGCINWVEQASPVSHTVWYFRWWLGDGIQNMFIPFTDGSRLATASWRTELKFKMVLASWRSNLENWMQFNMEKWEVSYLGGIKQL